jgi:DNA-binding NarL/FixJ family response regulator
MNFKVSIVEDDAEISKALALLLKSFPEVEHISTHNNSEAFINDFDSLIPDVVIMDIELPGMNGIECVRELKLHHPATQFMMCTVFEEDDKLFESLCAGATGYLLKNSSPEKIREALKEIFNGGSPMSPQIARKVVARFTPQAPNPELSILSEREKEILNYLSKGLRYKEIAAQVFVSTDTVRKHARNIYEKLQVNSRTEALNKVYGSRSF